MPLEGVWYRCLNCSIPVFIPISCELRPAYSAALADHFFFVEEEYQLALSCPRCMEQRFELLSPGVIQHETPGF